VLLFPQGLLRLRCCWLLAQIVWRLVLQVVWRLLLVNVVLLLLNLLLLSLPLPLVCFAVSVVVVGAVPSRREQRQQSAPAL
jgi:hypothetical protein